MADIRNFFGACSSNKRKSSVAENKKPSKRALIQSDSEDDNVKMTPTKALKSKSPIIIKKELDSISASDFFGSSEPKRKIEKNHCGKENIESSNTTNETFANKEVTPTSVENVTVKIEKEIYSAPSPRRVKKKQIASSHDNVNTPKKIKKKDDDIPHIDSPQSKINNMDDEPTNSIFNSSLNTSTVSRREAYEAFMNREGSQALNSRAKPKGPANCLSGKTFVITGVYETLTREDTEQLVVQHGGRVTKACSGRTTFLCLGRDGGVSKTAKAKKLGIQLLSEDEFYFLIDGKQPEPLNLDANDEDENMDSDSELRDAIIDEPIKSTESDEPIKSTESDELIQKSESDELIKKTNSDELIKEVNILEKPISLINNQETPHELKSTEVKDSGLWADRYSPQSLKKLIGQGSPGSSANVLLKWIKDFALKYNDPNLNNNKQYMFKKAVLLSGPPGIGKTTMAQLVCKEAGYNWIELNASDVRSKVKLKEHVTVCSSNTTITGFYTSGKEKIIRDCILMDEVDGMSGNSDRGGIQELISIIKATKIPIICMCNDRQSTSMRSLVKYTLDIKCFHPKLEQIKGAMRSVAFKEGLKIDSNSIDTIIMSANYDMRQIWNNLSMWSASEKLTADGILKDSKSSKKCHKLGPFDATKIIFQKWKLDSQNLVDTESLNEKFDMYFSDSQLMPFFIQDNYLRTSMTGVSRQDRLLKAAEASDWLSQGDIANSAIYAKQRFHLIPTHNLFSCVLPGQIMAGNNVRVDFPRSLGHISSTNKHKAQYLDLNNHMAKSMNVGLRELTLNIAPSLRTLLLSPLATHGLEAIDDVVATMNAYDLSREDFDSLEALAKLRNSKDIHIISSVKSAFTRKFNKADHRLPYSTTDLSKIISKEPKKATKSKTKVTKTSKTSKTAKETKSKKKVPPKKK